MADEDEVTNNAAGQQYELRVGDHLALAAYKLEGDVIRFTHTEVPEALEGQGIGSRLVGGALADVRRHELKVVPLCAFVRHYIDKHPETQDLLA
jgi:uncharacterized protein